MLFFFKGKVSVPKTKRKEKFLLLIYFVFEKDMMFVGIIIIHNGESALIYVFNFFFLFLRMRLAPPNRSIHPTINVMN